MKRAIAFITVFVAVAFLPVSATIINVPGDEPNIQAGINISSNDDTVRVASGTYVENIDFSGKNIVVGSWFLDDGDPSFISSTIIDGGASGSVVTFENGEDNTAVITGFTIQNGWGLNGGGIYCYNYSSPTISNNKVSGNSAVYDGGGLYCYYSSPTINYNTISENSAGWYGGGISCDDYSSPPITNTIFWDNSAPNGPEIYLSGTASPVITYCDVQGGWAGETNINCDPMFCDPESGNFYLHHASCCVGAGDGGVDIGAFGVGCGDIINIPADYETIQEGIDASSHYDIVRVASGTYVENIDFSGKNIVLGSWFLDAGDPSYISSTIIDGNQSGSVVSFLNGEDNSAVITGFTIQNGLAEAGGGIYCLVSNPTISNNTISGNSASAMGGGIGCWDNSSPTITDNTINGNSADRGGGIRCGLNSNATITSNTINGNSADRGAGIYCTSNTNLTINYNTISGNSAAYTGGGIYWFNNSGTTISNNTISENSAGSHGGGFYCIDSSPTISNNTISGNSCAFGGGGICCVVNSSPTISNNTISGNTANSWGGGIYCDDSSPVITNTIFWGDTAPAEPEIYLYGTSSPVITYCDVQGGWAGETNIDCDPMFCDPDNGNFYLNAASCCVGAGEGGVDIGAFGVSEVGCGYIINIPDDYETIQEGIDASSNGDTVRVASGTYVENIDFSGKNIVVGSWFLDAGDPSYISSTIIDGGASGSVVTFENGEDNTAIINGFTIQNGIAGYGGGIYCNSSSPTISNNTISENTANSWGGGIFCHSSSPTISNNTLSGNSAFEGGGIYCYESSSTINYNTISGNSAVNYGGGILFDFSNPTITNNTISENSSNDFGGGIYCYYSSSVITNTIFWGDSAPNGPEIYLYASSPVITYCDVQGGWAGEGNIDCDPMFCDPENGNFYLDAASCCVGEGEGGADIGAFGVDCGEQEIPTLSEWGMLILALLLLAVGTVAVVRRKRLAISKAA